MGKAGADNRIRQPPRYVRSFTLLTGRLFPIVEAVCGDGSMVGATCELFVYEAMVF